MARKIDLALGAFCLAFTAFFVIAAGVAWNARAGEAQYAALASGPGFVSLLLALLAAIPGIFLLWRGRSV